MVFARSQAQLDQRPRVGDRLALPSVVGLVAPHGLFTGLVPCAGSLALQIMLADQRFLNGLGSFRVDFLLAAHPLLSRGAFSPRGCARCSRSGRSGRRFCLALVRLASGRTCSRRLVCGSVRGRTLASCGRTTSAYHDQSTQPDQS